MIVIFEGPRASGKSTIIRLTHVQLESEGIESVIWKAERGKDPLEDMRKTIATSDFDPIKVVLVDRFHLSELVLSKYLRRNWETKSEWFDYEGKLRIIDGRLAVMNSIIFMISASLPTIKERLVRSRKADPALGAYDMWVQALYWTSCQAIHIPNDLWRIDEAITRYTIKPIISYLIKANAYR